MPILSKDFSERREAIRSILASRPIRSQGDLLRQLARRGFEVTQSSVSRDLQELNVVKVEGRYVLADSVLSSGASSGKAADAQTAGLEGAPWITRLEPAGNNLLVVQLPPGRAATLAVSIDQRRWPEIVGSIAGDDTIFIATRNRNDLVRLRQRLENARKGIRQ